MTFMLRLFRSSVCPFSNILCHHLERVKRAATTVRLTWHHRSSHIYRMCSIPRKHELACLLLQDEGTRHTEQHTNNTIVHDSSLLFIETDFSSIFPAWMFCMQHFTCYPTMSKPLSWNGVNTEQHARQDWIYCTCRTTLHLETRPGHPDLSTSSPTTLFEKLSKGSSKMLHGCHFWAAFSHVHNMGSAVSHSSTNDHCALCLKSFGSPSTNHVRIQCTSHREAQALVPAVHLFSFASTLLLLSYTLWSYKSHCRFLEVSRNISMIFAGWEG